MAATRDAEPAISVRELRKAYGELEAVRGVSFEVSRGEVFCLLGPNGAGKTTTGEILEGYRSHTSGEAWVLGMDPARGERELPERVGIVLQQSGAQNDPRTGGIGLKGADLQTLAIWTVVGIWLMLRFLRRPLGDGR